jgi:hypothetical protein
LKPPVSTDSTNSRSCPQFAESPFRTAAPDGNLVLVDLIGYEHRRRHMSEVNITVVGNVAAELRLDKSPHNVHEVIGDLRVEGGTVAP